jgi:hypothetical protein
MSLNYFVEIKNNSPIPRIHPILLSLAEAFNKSNKSPELNLVSEEDPRVIGKKDYTPPSEFPPLEIHLYEGNSVSFCLLPVASYSHRQLNVGSAGGGSKVRLYH